MASDLDPYDSPEAEKAWCEQQRSVVAEYLARQGVEHGQLGEWPAWHVAPYVAVWAVESRRRPGAIGWWAISGDLPTDYISSADVESPQHPRKAVRAIACRWLVVATAWQAGGEVDGIRISGPVPRAELAPLLESRAKLLLEWVDDPTIWDE